MKVTTAAAPALEPAAAPYMPVTAKSEHWCTPPEILEPVRKGFGGTIALDPCGNPWSIVGAKQQIWLPEHACNEAPNCDAHPLPGNVVLGDGLLLDWWGNVFFNPPYDAKGLKAFMVRARDVARMRGGGHAVGFVPLKTEQDGWQETVPEARLLCFVKGRVRHLLPSGQRAAGAPFPQALVLWTRSDRLVYRMALALEEAELGTVTILR